MKTLREQKAFTIIEMLTTIVVTSMLTIILMQILMLVLKANVELETRNRYQTESYIMSETIRDLVFELKPQELELIRDNDSETVIELRHLYGYTTNEDNEIVPDPNPVTDVIRLDKTNGDLYYNSQKINDSNVALGPNSAINLISIDPATCDLSSRECEEGILELQFEIIVLLPDGDALAPKVYVTRILI